MTSANFKVVPVDSIIINRDERQRRELRGIEELASSISARGLIHPPVVTEDLVLVAGERRLTAIRSLGWTSVPVQFAEDLPPEELQLIELEENTKRLDITWQEHVNAVTRYHDIQSSIHPEWSVTKTSKELSIAIGQTSDILAVGKKMDDERISAAPTLSTARSIVARMQAREKAAVASKISAAITPIKRVPADLTVVGEEPIPEPEPEPEVPLIHADCLEWAKTYTGPEFNFIHCDFPYGIDANTAPKTEKSAYNTTAAVHMGGYDDSEAVYWHLLKEVLPALPIAESAHMMFWFSMKYYEETKATLESQGWIVNAFPLIWHKSDNAGVLPDPQYGFRRTYETAFHCRRGNRPIVKSVAGSFPHPSEKATRIHMSQKPRAVLEHFFKMYVDEYTAVLDPTCGSGNAPIVAHQMGAAKVLGIDKSDEFIERAVEAWKEAS